jgi:hypothetical protein
MQLCEIIAERFRANKSTQVHVLNAELKLPLGTRIISDIGYVVGLDVGLDVLDDFTLRRVDVGSTRGRLIATYQVQMPVTRVRQNWQWGPEVIEGTETIRCDEHELELVENQDMAMPQNAYYPQYNAGTTIQASVVMPIKTIQHEDNVSVVTSEKETQPKQQKKEEKQTMATTTVTPASLFDMAKSDVNDALYRTAATQLTNVVAGLVAEFLKAEGADDGVLKFFANQAEKPLGKALTSAVIGYGLTALPQYSSDARVTKLSKEFRVGGFAGGLNEVANKIAPKLLPAVMTIIEGLPE